MHQAVSWNQERREEPVEIVTGGETARRILDLAVGLLLLLVAIPLIAAFAVIVAVSLRANPFFTQTRIGRDGRSFRFLKLRTLPPTAPAYADKYEIERVAMPAFCRLLRSTHLDELPQLFLVVAGRMSLVGPRPEMPQLHEELGAVHAQARAAMRPGCTGLWQVSIDNDRLILEAPEYDLAYAENASVLLDLWVLWRTALLVVGGDRIAMDDVPQWALRQRSPHAAFEPALLQESVAA